MSLDEMDAAIAAAYRRHMRSIFTIETRCDEAAVLFTLGCGHVVTVHVAGHPVAFIDPLLDLGDEVDCPHCASPA